MQDIYKEEPQSKVFFSFFLYLRYQVFFWINFFSVTVVELGKDDADRSFNPYDIKRLEMYAQNLVDYHLVIDLVPEMAKLYFTNKLGADFSLSLVQSV